MSTNPKLFVDHGDGRTSLNDPRLVHVLSAANFALQFATSDFSLCLPVLAMRDEQGYLTVFWADSPLSDIFHSVISAAWKKIAQEDPSWVEFKPYNASNGKRFRGIA